MSGKRLTFALMGSMIFWVGAADVYAETEANDKGNEILRSETETYDMKKDPLLVNFLFGKTEGEQKEEMRADPFRNLSEKEREVLERWKTKQAEKWESLPKERFIVNASAYTASADECGNDKGITASGLLVKKEQTLACPPEFPFGALIAIEGVGTLRCEDRGGAIKGNHFDIYMETKKEAFAFGRRNLVAEVVYE